MSILKKRQCGLVGGARSSLRSGLCRAGLTSMTQGTALVQRKNVEETTL
jgi:hypothetical protein